MRLMPANMKAANTLLADLNCPELSKGNSLMSPTMTDAENLNAALISIHYIGSNEVAAAPDSFCKQHVVIEAWHTVKYTRSSQ